MARLLDPASANRSESAPAAPQYIHPLLRPTPATTLRSPSLLAPPNPDASGPLAPRLGSTQKRVVIATDLLDDIAYAPETETGATSNAPYHLLDELDSTAVRRELGGTQKNRTPVEAANSLMNYIGQKVRTNSMGVRGRSATANSEHILSAGSGARDLKKVKRQIFVIVCIMPLYCIVVSLLRLNLLSTVYIVSFLLSSTTHPYLTGIEPQHSESRSINAVYLAGGGAAVSLAAQVAAQVAVQYYPGLYNEEWVQLVGACNFGPLSIMERLRCTLLETIVLAVAIFLKMLERKAAKHDAATKPSLGGLAKRIGGVGVARTGAASKICSISTVAVFSGMSAASHAALTDVPFLLLFIAYCVCWSRDIDIERSFLSRFELVACLRGYCGVLYALHYATFVPYLAQHIPNNSWYKMVGLTWLHDDHGTVEDGQGHWEAVQIEAGNVVHIVFLSLLFLLLCAYFYSKRTSGDPFAGKPVEDVDMTHTQSIDVIDITLQGMLGISELFKHIKGEIPGVLSHMRLPEAPNLNLRAAAQRKGGQILNRIITLAYLHGHRYSSRILVALIALVVVLQPSVISAVWLVVFLLSLLRRYTFFALLTPVMMLAVVHILGLWVVAVSNVADADATDEAANATWVRRLQVAGFAASDCGGLGKNRCTLVLLVTLGLLLASVSLTTKMYLGKKRSMISNAQRNQMEKATSAESVVDKWRRAINNSMLMMVVLWMFFTSVWTIDGAHAVLFLMSLLYFFYPKLAERTWSFVLLYVCTLLTVIYLFKVLERDFIPSLADHQDKVRDFIGFHDRDSWQFFPLFILLFLAIKQRDLLASKRARKEEQEEYSDIEHDFGADQSELLSVDSCNNLSRRDATQPPEVGGVGAGTAAGASLLGKPGLPSHMKRQSPSEATEETHLNPQFVPFVFVARITGLPWRSGVLDIVALGSVLTVGIIGEASILSGLTMLLFLGLSAMCLTPGGIALADSVKKRVWQVARFHVALWLVFFYFFQWHLSHDGMEWVFDNVGLTPEQFGVQLVSENDGGSLKALRGMVLYLLALILCHVEVQAASDPPSNLGLCDESVSRRDRLVRSMKWVAVSYISTATSITLFVAAVFSTSHFRSSVFSIPYAVFLCIYLFSPAFGRSHGTSFHVSFAVYAACVMVASFLYQFPAVTKTVNGIGVNIAAYIGFRSGSTADILWTHLLVYVVSLANITVVKWRRAGSSEVKAAAAKREPVEMPAKDCGPWAYLKYVARWTARTATGAVLDFGRDPLRAADSYAFHASLFSFLVAIVLQPYTARSLVLLLLLGLSGLKGREGMGLLLVGRLERWFFVTLVTWVLLIYQYFTYLGLPPDFSDASLASQGDAHRLPYDVASLGEYKQYLGVNVTPWELAVDVVVAVGTITQWGVYKRMRESGVDPVVAYRHAPTTSSQFLVANKQALAQARRAIWALYGSGVVPERVPYPLGDLHMIAHESGFPVPGCGCDACSHPKADVRPHEDYTPSAQHRRDPGEKLLYGASVFLPYATVILMFVDGATAEILGGIDMVKVLMSLLFFHTIENVKWRGTRQWNWINRVYFLFLLFSCVVSIPAVSGHNKQTTIKRHFAVKNYFMHAFVMVLAYLMQRLLVSRRWIWILYNDQQLEIRSRDVGESIQQEWLWELDTQKRQLRKEAARRKHKLAAVKLGHSSTEIMVCPVCARRPHDELCESCMFELGPSQDAGRRHGSGNARSNAKACVQPAPCKTLSVLEERLLQEGLIDRAEHSVLDATRADSEASSDTTVAPALAEDGSWRRSTSHGSPSEGAHTSSHMDVQGVSTITLGGKQSKGTAPGSPTLRRFVVSQKPKKQDFVEEVDEFSSFPFAHMVNRSADVATKFLMRNSLGHSPKVRDRYTALRYAVWWFVRSHTDKICYASFIANFVNNPCILSMPLAVSVFVYALVLYPRPHVKYWVYCLYCLNAVVVLKSLCHSLLAGDVTEASSVSTSDSEFAVRATSSFADLQVMVPFLFGTISDFSGAVAFDLVSILAIIVHQRSQSDLGLSTDAALYFKYEFRNKVDQNEGDCVTVLHESCEEVVDGDLFVMDEAYVEFTLSGGMLYKSTDGMQPRVVTHLYFNTNERSLRDQDGCGGTIPEASVGHVLRDVGRLADLAGIETDIPCAGGAAVAAVKAVTERRDSSWGPFDFLVNNIMDANKLKTGMDFYFWMFVLDFIVFVMFIFSFYAIQSERSNGDLAASLSSNMLPGSLVLTQLGLLLIIIMDRVLYLYKNVGAKFLFHILLSGAYFALFSLWHAARLTQEVEANSTRVISSFAKPESIRVVAALFYLKVMYLAVSAQQIRAGFLELSNYLAFQERHHPVFHALYVAFRAVPFVYELKVIIDWTFTATTLKFMWWIKLQDITHELYTARCDLEDTRLLKKQRDKTLKFPPLIKGAQGCTIAAILIVIMFFPLMYYSSFSPALTDNYAEHVRMSVGLVGAPALYTGREALPKTDRRDVSEEALRRAQFTRPSLFGFTFEGRTIQMIEMPEGSQSVWWLPNDAREQVTDLLWDGAVARGLLAPHDADKDGVLSLTEARSVLRFASPLGPLTCPPEGPECHAPAGCGLPAWGDDCCKGMALWSTVLNATGAADGVALGDEAALLELYGVGGYRMPHDVNMQLDVEVTRAEAPETQLLVLQTKSIYTLPPAARTSLYNAFQGNSSVVTQLPDFYPPLLFNRRKDVALYEAAESTRIHCTLAVEPGLSEVTGVSYYTAGLTCDSLFSEGNPLDAGFKYSPEEGHCFNMSKYYRWSKCPNYDTAPSCVFKERPLYLVTASDTVAKSSGLGALLASFSVTALYTTFVLTIGRLIRSFFGGSAYKVVLQDMQDPRPVEYIILCMHYARCEGDLVLEEALYQELLRLYRSPESLREFTARDVV